MNNARRKKIEDITTRIETLVTELEEIRDDEQSAFDSIPESLQESEKGETMQAHIENLESCVSSLNDVLSYLSEIE